MCLMADVEKSNGDPHHTTIRVRYVECDPMGLAHHSSYPVWFEMGRMELFRSRSATDYRAMEAAGAFLAVTALSIRYRRPARYDDVLELETVITRIGRARIDHAYTLRCNGVVITTAESTLACLNADGQPCALPDAISGR